MKNKKIKEDFEFLTTFDSLAHALQEVSIIKMQSVRDLVLQARQFHDGLAESYKDVRATIIFDPEIDENTTITPTKESVAVLFSANASMYGTLTQEVYRDFKAHMKKHPQDDVVILGKLGKERFEKDAEIRKEFIYFELVAIEKLYVRLLKVISELIFYKKVTIFYGSFVSVFTQQPEQKVLPGNLLFRINEEADKKQKGEAKTEEVAMNENGEQLTDFRMEMISLLEPSAKELEMFFSSQVMGMIFRQTLFEFELARHGARITSLEKSIDNTQQLLKKVLMDVKKMKRAGNEGGISKTIAFFRKQQAVRR